MLLEKLNQESIKKALDILQGGGVVVFPTDTVYGILADAQNKEAVDRIFKIKNRPKEKPLPVFVRDIEAAQKIAHISSEQEKVLQEFWPGNNTFVLKIKPGAKIFGAGQDTVALRVPRHEKLIYLLKEMDRPLVQTSANLSGKSPMASPDEIYKQFKDSENGPDIIIDAGKLEGKPSKVIDLTSGVLTRLR